MATQLLPPTEHAEPAARMVPAPVAAADASDPRAQVNAEADLVHHILRATAVAVPLLVGVWVGLIAIAVSLSGGIGYASPLAMGAAVGVLAGVFWGSWAGFVSYNNRYEIESRHAPEVEHGRNREEDAA